MGKVYYEMFISAKDQKQADAILNSLLEKRLITGGQFLRDPARFLWKGQVEDIENTATEEFPMIRFIQIEVNNKLASWIEETLA
jgi:uncharacterized protein involved in tolerance to divalent cations